MAMSFLFSAICSLHGANRTAQKRNSLLGEARTFEARLAATSASAPFSMEQLGFALGPVAAAAAQCRRDTYTPLGQM
jgi:hypothetical protein